MYRPDHERYHQHGRSTDLDPRACSRDDDPTQHDCPTCRNAGGFPCDDSPNGGRFIPCPDCARYGPDYPAAWTHPRRPAPVSPWARRAIAHQLPASAHGARAYAR